VLQNPRMDFMINSIPDTNPQTTYTQLFKISMGGLYFEETELDEQVIDDFDFYVTYVLKSGKVLEFKIWQEERVNYTLSNTRPFYEAIYRLPPSLNPGNVFVWL
jgi:hypothetical protein